MKKLLILSFILIFACPNFAQKDQSAENSADKEELKQINEFIKQAFSTTYKVKKPSTVLDLDAKKEIKTTQSYEGRLMNFKGCNISFYSSTKIEHNKQHTIEKAIISLKDIDSDKTTFSDKEDSLLIIFKAKGNQILREVSFLSTNFGPNTDKYSYNTFRSPSSFIWLKSDKSVEEIEASLRKAIRICQEK